LQGQWQPGLSGLEAGLSLMDSEASSGMKDRLRIWVAQALALAEEGLQTGWPNSS